MSRQFRRDHRTAVSSKQVSCESGNTRHLAQHICEIHSGKITAWDQVSTRATITRCRNRASAGTPRGHSSAEKTLSAMIAEHRTDRESWQSARNCTMMLFNLQNRSQAVATRRVVVPRRGVRGTRVGVCGCGQCAAFTSNLCVRVAALTGDVDARPTFTRQ